MRLKSIALQDFRNVELCVLESLGGRVFLLGANAQGKTNLLEAVAMVSALRSFRTQDTAALLRGGMSQGRIFVKIEHEQEGQTEIEIVLGKQGRQALLNGVAVSKLSDLLGRFPVVAMSSDDMRLLRGSPADRRRAFDLLFSSGSMAYFDALRRYHTAMKARNELLRADIADEAQFAAFEASMAHAAEILRRLRVEGLAVLAADVRAAYAAIDGGADIPDLAYASAGGNGGDAVYWQRVFSKNRPRERLLQRTLEGPHRDDYRFLLGGQSAREYGSEGQQRALVVSWRLAQAHWLERACKIAPVLVADDILGELDPVRRAGFWRAVAGHWQVLASGTEPPTPHETSEPWQHWQVSAGNFSLCNGE